MRLVSYMRENMRRQTRLVIFYSESKFRIDIIFPYYFTKDIVYKEV